MKPGRFVLYEPTSVDQAVLMLADVADQDGRILAGGQTLVPAMALRFAQPAYLIDINRIEALGALIEDAGALRIHARVRHAAFHAPAASGPLGHLLSGVVKHIAHLPIRTRGTFCGSLANADPASEWCLVSVTLDATMRARSHANGPRDIAAADYFQGYMTTALRPDELLESVALPLLPANARWGFEEFSRRAGDFAQAMALVVLRIDGTDSIGTGKVTGTNRGAGERVTDVRIGVGGVESTPRRLREAEAMCEGQALTPSLILAVADRAAALVEPMDTTPQERQYRRGLVRTVVQRALQRALQPALQRPLQQPLQKTLPRALPADSSKGDQA
jgi:aerobic carbon-monoxide dehydrogenase medium subunit